MNIECAFAMLIFHYKINRFGKLSFEKKASIHHLQQDDTVLRPIVITMRPHEFLLSLIKAVQGDIILLRLSYNIILAG